MPRRGTDSIGGKDGIAMWKYLDRKLQPAVWQGGRPPFFEGWYYKVQAPDGNIFCAIPGVSLQKNDPHCFIQLMDGGRSRYLRYRTGAFHAATECLEVRIGDSVFTEKGLHLRTHIMQADILFSSPVPYSAHRHTLGIMGPFALLPGLECRHGVILADCRAQGRIQTGAGERTFSDGRGYVEKDWGHSFPHSYVWCQAFLEDGASFMLSAATVPLGGRLMRGLIAFLHTREGWSKWATYAGARVLTSLHRADSLTLRVAAPGSRLGLTLWPGGENPLAAPIAAGMERQIRESAAGRLELTVTDRHGKTRYRGGCGHASIEICGDPAALAEKPPGG